MATTRVNKIDMAANSYPRSFDGGVCDCAIIKNVGVATAFTYGGVSMVKLLPDLTDSSGATHQMWGLQNAPQGIVTISMAGTSSLSSAETYSGVNTTATFPNIAGSAEHHLGSGSLTSIQVDVTTTVDDCILVGLGGYRGSVLTDMFAGSNTSVISAYPPSFSDGTDLSFESNPLDVGIAGTYHLEGLTGGGSTDIVISLMLVALAPGPAATSFIPQMIII